LNKIVSTKTTSSIFLAALLVVGTIATILPSAQAQPYYEMNNGYGSYEPGPAYTNNNSYESEYASDNSYYKSKDSNVILKKINCNNINSNNNGVDVNLGVPNNDALVEAQAAEGSETTTANGLYDERNGYKQNDNGFKFVCINNNDNENNVVVVNETTPEPTPEPTITCEECFTENLRPERLAILLELFEDTGITLNIRGEDVVINSFTELCAQLQGKSGGELLFIVQTVAVNLGPTVAIVLCLDEDFDFSEI